MLVLTATLVLAHGVKGTQSTTIVSSSSITESPSSGSILYKDSFETSALGKFGWAFGTLPSGWGPDISDEHGSFGEVENTTVQEGKQAVLLHAPQFNESTGRVYSNIARALRGLAEPGFSEFYVRWYVRFQVLPGTNWRYIQMSHISNGDHATETASVILSRINDTYFIGISNMWGNITQKSAPYPFAVDTWYRFDLYYKYGVADGEYRLWINKEEVIAVTNQDTTPRWNGVPRPFDPVYLPKDWDGGNEHTDDTQGYYLYVDNFLFADYRVDLDWAPPETATITIRAFDNKTKNPIPNALVKMGSYEGYTNESGLITFTGMPTILYTLNVSEQRHHAVTELVDIYSDKNMEFYLDPIQFEVNNELPFEYKLAALVTIIIIALIGTTFILKHFRV